MVPGRLFDSGAEDTVVGRVLKIWDGGGHLIRTLEDDPDHRVPFVAVAFSNDGSRLAAVDLTCVIATWDLRTGRKLLSFDELKVGDKEAAEMRSFAFDDAAQRVACIYRAKAGTLATWYLATGLTRMMPNRWNVNGLAVSHDGRRLAAANSYHRIAILDFETGEEVGHHQGELVEKNESLTSLLFSPDDEQIATGSGKGVVRVWNVRGNRPPQVFHGPKLMVRQMVFIRGGIRILAGARNFLEPDPRTKVLKREPLVVWDVALARQQATP
jgi:WD40 repeat protein